MAFNVTYFAVDINVSMATQNAVLFLFCFTGF